MCNLLMILGLSLAVAAGGAQGTTPNTMRLAEGAPRPPARVADFRLRLARTRERHLAIDKKIHYVRSRLDELRERLGPAS